MKNKFKVLLILIFILFTSCSIKKGLHSNTNKNKQQKVLIRYDSKGLIESWDGKK